MRVLLSTLCCLALLASAALAGDGVPNLVGKYTGTAELHLKDKGFAKGPQPMVLEILEQQGHTFHGVKTWTQNDGKKGSETFSGVIAGDGKTLYIAEHESGILVGELSSDGQALDLCYVDDGEKPKAIYYPLKRMK